MPARSTRERIQDQLDKAVVTLDRPVLHLMRADVLQKGRMVELDTALPAILGAIEKVKGAIMELRHQV